MSKKIIIAFTYLIIFYSNMAFANSLGDEFKIFNYENECRYCALTDKVFSRDTLLSTKHVNASLSFAYLGRTLWQGINLQGADFHDIYGDRMHFENCNLRNANLSRSSLPYLQMDPSNQLEVVNFSGSGLEYSNFSGTNMDRPYFDYTVLEEAHFLYAKIFEGNFISARLTDADFTEALVRDSDFTGAKLHGVDFTRADLRGSKISREQFATVKSVCGAYLPDGSRGSCE